MAGSWVTILASKLWNRFRVRRHPYQVAQVVQETHDTWSLHFEGRRIDYQPGQFLMVWLIRNGRVSEPHPFTISSSPTKDRLSISVKSVGDFTSTIRDTKPTDRAYIDAPYGAFSFLNHDAQNLVFIAGGIGITPFMSMLRYMADKGLDRTVLLIWGNKAERDIAFRDELDNMVAEMSSLRVEHVMSGQDDWPGEKGYVDAALLSKHLQDVENPQVFVCGPPVMMAKVIAALRELGVPKQRIHYERFALR
jgi:ferredoxin-NADP reductase